MKFDDYDFDKNYAEESLDDKPKKDLSINFDPPSKDDF